MIYDNKIEQIYVPLKNLFLDHKNFRFKEKAQALNNLKSGEEFSDRIQNKILNLLIDKEQGISDLLISFKANGFINVNQIYVKKINDEKYLVIEGNRRVATLKYLEKKSKDEFPELGKLDPEVFNGVPVVIYPYEELEEHLILAGLDHITGKKNWPSVNRAEYFYSLIKDLNKSQEYIVERLADITKHEVRRSLRTLALIKLFRKSEYFNDSIEDVKYTIFREITSKPDLREWLSLEFENEEACDLIHYNKTNIEKIFSWISSVDRDPILKDAGDIGKLNKIIVDPNALDILEDSNDLEKALHNSKHAARENVKDNLKKATAYIESIKNFSVYLEKNDLVDIIEIERTAREISYTISEEQNTYKQKAVILNPLKPKSHFTNIHISDYKLLKNLKIENPGRINIFAGANNRGKTSILEAIYYLANLNEPFEFLESLSNRGKIYNNPYSEWISENTHNLTISGNYSGDDYLLTTSQEQEKDPEIDKKSYISSIFLKAKRENEEELSSKIQLFKPFETKVFYEDAYKICNISYSTPFNMNLENFVKKYYPSNESFIIEVIDFIKENIDSEVEDIRYSPKLQRFNVIKKKETIDLSMFGSGMQFIFYTSILFSNSKNGVVLIDELENGIHYRLLKQYTLFLQKLAEKYNVQVFATSHSRECIDAFLLNYYNNDDIVGYALYQDEKDQLNADRVSGRDFQKFIEKFNFDLRGE